MYKPNMPSISLNELILIFASISIFYLIPISLLIIIILKLKNNKK